MARAWLGMLRKAMKDCFRVRQVLAHRARARLAKSALASQAPTLHLVTMRRALLGEARWPGAMPGATPLGKWLAHSPKAFPHQALGAGGLEGPATRLWDIPSP